MDVGATALYNAARVIGTGRICKMVRRGGLLKQDGIGYSRYGAGWTCALDWIPISHLLYCTCSSVSVVLSCIFIDQDLAVILEYICCTSLHVCLFSSEILVTSYWLILGLELAHSSLGFIPSYQYSWGIYPFKHLYLWQYAFIRVSNLSTSLR